MTSETQSQSTLDELPIGVVSTPLRFDQKRGGGAWAQWCARRRDGLPAGVGWDDPRLIIDLTAPVSTVTLAPVVGAEEPARTGTVPERLVTLSAVAIVVLNVLDVVTTRVALVRGGTEGNPLASLFVYHLPIFVAIKVLFPGFVALRMWVTRTRTPPALLAVMFWVVGVYSMAIVVNALHLL
jgi:hypothetical protein